MTDIELPSYGEAVGAKEVSGPGSALPAAPAESPWGNSEMTKNDILAKYARTGGWLLRLGSPKTEYTLRGPCIVG